MSSRATARLANFQESVSISECLACDPHDGSYPNHATNKELETQNSEPPTPLPGRITVVQRPLKTPVMVRLHPRQPFYARELCRHACSTAPHRAVCLVGRASSRAATCATPAPLRHTAVPNRIACHTRFELGPCSPALISGTCIHANRWHSS